MTDKRFREAVEALPGWTMEREWIAWGPHGLTACMYATGVVDVTGVTCHKSARTLKTAIKRAAADARKTAEAALREAEALEALL